MISRQRQGQSQQKLPGNEITTASLSRSPLSEEWRRSVPGPPHGHAQQFSPPHPYKEPARTDSLSRTGNGHLPAQSPRSVPPLPPKPGHIRDESNASEVGNMYATNVNRDAWPPLQTMNQSSSHSVGPRPPLPQQYVQSVYGQTYSGSESDTPSRQYAKSQPYYFQQPASSLRPSYRQLPRHTAPKRKQPVVDLMSSPLETTLFSQSGQANLATAPPIPPNPEKDALLNALSHALRTQLKQAITQNNAALPALQTQNAALQQAYQNMQSEMSQLQQLDKMLNSNEKILHNAMRDADHVMESVGQREIPAVDDVLVAPTVVGEQLYGLVADERSIADAMFMLTRALDRGRVGGDVFLKVS